ncbi:hypothetical protein [Mycolicibacter kumamotonensis]|uniref:hypothetical protein n=1 Tax=Mycolicibacter kumamotonensis TaxID=354243 RepID=UPI0013FE4768|nr:hypothetical protein [Mycolicibacter kumamotonensis]
MQPGSGSTRKDDSAHAESVAAAVNIHKSAACPIETARGQLLSESPPRTGLPWSVFRRSSALIDLIGCGWLQVVSNVAVQALVVHLSA